MRNGMVLYSGTRRERERQMNEKQWSEEKSAWQDGENVLNWLSCSREIGWNTSKYVWKKKWKKFLTNLWKWCKINKLLDWVAKNIVPCKLNNVTWTNYKPEILLKFILRKRTGRCKTGIEITASQHIAEIFDYNELCS